MGQLVPDTGTNSNVPFLPSVTGEIHWSGGWIPHGSLAGVYQRPSFLADGSADGAGLSHVYSLLISSHVFLQQSMDLQVLVLRSKSKWCEAVAAPHQR